VLSSEFYRRAMATLEEVKRLHVVSRTLSRGYRSRISQRHLSLQAAYFAAPQSLRLVRVESDQAGERETHEHIQVGATTFRRGDASTDGEWSIGAPILDSPSALPDFLCGYLRIPSTRPHEGGNFHDVAFGVPEWTKVRVDGRESVAIALPVYSQSHPRVWFPGIAVPRGARMPQVWHEEEWKTPILTSAVGRLFVNGRTGIPIRFVSAETAVLEDGTAVVLTQQHVRFRVGEEFEIRLPEEGR
jgi:hypothetical protein